MKTNIQKRKYTEPRLEQIRLDNEISLALESAPPVGPFESANSNIPDFFNNDPFKTNVG
jgi:hypothetical protein